VTGVMAARGVVESVSVNAPFDALCETRIAQGTEPAHRSERPRRTTTPAASTIAPYRRIRARSGPISGAHVVEGLRAGTVGRFVVSVRE